MTSSGPWRTRAAWLTENQAHGRLLLGRRVPNANSTGVAAQALVLLGEDAAAAEPPGGSPSTRWGRAPTGPWPSEAGAVAFDDQALAAAQDGG